MSDNNSSNCCKELPVGSRKALAYFIYKQNKVQSHLCHRLSHAQACNLNTNQINVIPIRFTQNLTCFSSGSTFCRKKCKKKSFYYGKRTPKAASKAYVYRKLREVPFTGALSKKKFNSLREETLQSINSNKTFAPGKKLAKLTPQQVSVVQNFIDTTKSIQIDAQAFWRLVKQCGIPNYPKGKKTESDLTDFYYHLFNFTKLGFRTRDSLTSGKKFRSLATTKNPSDFIDDIRNGCIFTILTAVDTSGRQRTTSLDEYYHLCGYNNANFIRKKHQEQHTAQFLKISNLSSLKTSNITEFAKACQERLSLYDDIASYYNENAWSSKLKFQCYIPQKNNNCFWRWYV
ncbi:hypothetical protein BCV72DRAFT_249522 [Rhizopus microsporus var. microsporus]|uniref:Uncharacterized protein n=1 Tax=Rhizopus microsporus var. microsporus TaxID=86635 RepID=A0A1X0R5N7_RHIZD|nr:hypothetical protein BCV72DRAFT_249522 [Rhizopus microsporus var. microsporus]